MGVERHIWGLYIYDRDVRCALDNLHQGMGAAKPESRGSNSTLLPEYSSTRSSLDILLRTMQMVKALSQPIQLLLYQLECFPHLMQLRGSLVTVLNHTLSTEDRKDRREQLWPLTPNGMPSNSHRIASSSKVAGWYLCTNCFCSYSSHQ